MIVLVLFVALIIFAVSFRAFSSKVKVTVCNEQCELDGCVWFAGYSLLMAPILLSAIKEAKYIWWFVVIAALTLLKKCNFSVLTHFKTYVLYFLWCLFGLFVGNFWIRGSLMLVKLSLVVAFAMIGYCCVPNRKSMTFCYSAAASGTILPLLLVSGYAEVIYPAVYWGASSVFFSYAGLADCFTVLVPTLLGMFVFTNKKKFLLWAALLGGSSVVAVVRTGIGGFFIAVSLFALLRYRFKAVPGVFLLFLVAIACIFFVPQVREKCFDTQTVERIEREGVGLYLLDAKIRDSGRENLRDIVMRAFNNRDPFCGAGTGATNVVLRVFASRGETAAIAHNDYFVAYVDNGIIGLSLFILAMFFCVTHSIALILSGKYSNETVLAGQVGVSSLAGALFAMGFDNVLGHITSSIGVSMILLGIFFRGIDEEDRMRKTTTRGQNELQRNHTTVQ